jgi:hypothetical protein
VRSSSAGLVVLMDRPESRAHGRKSPQTTCPDPKTDRRRARQERRCRLTETPTSRRRTARRRRSTRPATQWCARPPQADRELPGDLPAPATTCTRMRAGAGRMPRVPRPDHPEHRRPLRRSRPAPTELAGHPAGRHIRADRNQRHPRSQLLADAFTAAGHSVTFPHHEPGDLGVMIISKLTTTPDRLALDYLPARAAAVLIDTSTGPLRVLGAYVPSPRRPPWTRPNANAAGSNRTTSGSPPPLFIPRQDGAAKKCDSSRRRGPARRADLVVQRG